MAYKLVGIDENGNLPPRAREAVAASDEVTARVESLVANAPGQYAIDVLDGNLYSTDVVTGQRRKLTSGLTFTTQPTIVGTAAVFSTSAGRFWVPLGGGDIRSADVKTNVLASWGSSTMGGLISRLDTLAAQGGMTHVAGGVGGAIAETILPRYGSHPLLINAVTIPASGGVTITASNFASNNYAALNYEATIAGVLGTVSKTAQISSPITFTRTTAGGAVNVAAGTPVIPTAGMTARNAVTLLQTCDNNLSGDVTNANRSTEDMIHLTNEAYEWAGSISKQVLVFGYWVDTNTPEGAEDRDRIFEYNARMKERYGRRFLDVGGYFTSAQVWIDAGITPTATDLAQQALGNKPPSLSGDELHLNAKGYDLLVALIKARLVELGWWAPAPAPTLIYDDFQRADSTNIGTTTVGGASWTPVPNSGQIVGGAVAYLSGQTAPPRLATGRTNYRVTATVATSTGDPATSQGGVIVRMVDGSNYWWLSTRVSGSQSGLTFYRNVGGSIASVGTSVATQIKAGDVLTVEAVGDVLVGYLNGTEVARIAGVTSMLDGANVGLLMQAQTGTTWADFRVEAL